MAKHCCFWNGFIIFWYWKCIFAESFGVGSNRNKISGAKWKSVAWKLAFHVRALCNWWTSVDFEVYTFFRFVGIGRLIADTCYSGCQLQPLWFGLGSNTRSTLLVPLSNSQSQPCRLFWGWHFTCVSSCLFCMYLSKHLYLFHHHITQVWMNLGWQLSSKEWRGILSSLCNKEWTKILRLAESLKENKDHCCILLLKCWVLTCFSFFILCPCRNMPESSVPVAPLDCYDYILVLGNSSGIPNFYYSRFFLYGGIQIFRHMFASVCAYLLFLESLNIHCHHIFIYRHFLW